MRSLRGLLVDNERKNNDATAESLDLAFDTFGWKIDWTKCSSAAKAQKIVRDAQPFDFAIIDECLSAGEPSGLSILPDLVLANPDTFILVVTSFPDFDRNFRDRACKAGAFAAIERNEMLETGTEWSFPALSQKIRDHLVARGIISLGKFSYSHDDVCIVSMFERLGGLEGSEEERIRRGERVVHNLAMGCLERPRIDEGSFFVSYLTPGNSGALVCRVDLRMVNRPSESFVLKVGLDRRALEREVVKNEEASRVLTQHVLVRTEGRVRGDLSGYHAIAAKVAEGADTLATRLAGVD